MSNYDHFYGPMDIHWCRDLRPLSIKLNQLKTDGNRYHYMLAIRLLALGISKFLVKPYAGFSNPSHESFFNASWDKNFMTGISYAVSTTRNAGYISGAVYAGTTKIANKIQPIYGTRDKADTVRYNFERYHLSGRSIRAAWTGQGIVSKMKAGDRRYNYYLIAAKGNKKKVKISQIQKDYPGWLPDDGSEPILVVPSLI